MPKQDIPVDKPDRVGIFPKGPWPVGELHWNKYCTEAHRVTHAGEKEQ